MISTIIPINLGKGEIKFGRLEEGEGANVREGLRLLRRPHGIGILTRVVTPESREFQRSLSVCLRSRSSGIRTVGLKRLKSWLAVASYSETLRALVLCRRALSKTTSVKVYRVVEAILNHCLHIRSGAHFKALKLFFDSIKGIAKLVLYISSREDAHLNRHMAKMDRRCIFVHVDIYLDMYRSPQGYSTPGNTVELIFAECDYIWFRKPKPVPQKNGAIEALTRNEIRDYVDSLLLIYEDKRFPQALREGKKRHYLRLLTSKVDRLKLVPTIFDNSTISWKNGDLIKPLAMQAHRDRSGRALCAFSPFIYHAKGAKGELIKSMPPLMCQPFLPKEFEVRGNYFRGEFSMVKIRPELLSGKKALIDWRFANGLGGGMEAFDAEDWMTIELDACFRALGLEFCTFDLIFDGIDFFLLDINYNGQWIFSDLICSMKITRSMLDSLGR